MPPSDDIQPPALPGKPVDKPGNSVYLGLAPPERRRSALAQLLTGRPNENDIAVTHFERFAREQRLNLDQVWIAGQGGPEGRLMGSILLVPNPGATAMLFAGSASGWHDHDTVARLIQKACQNPHLGSARLVQTLIDPDQVMEADVLQRAGLTRLAKLIYMQRASDRSARGVRLPQALGQAAVTAYPGQPQHMDRIGRAIAASYEDTLDCPGLLGHRTIAQTVEGHKATGRFDASLWHAFFDDRDQPVAVLLLAEASQGGAHELVYLGVAKPYRGRGVAAQLMAYALSKAVRLGGSKLFLAVDDRNTPALRLYKGLGFRATARKVAYILPLSR